MKQHEFGALRYGVDVCVYCSKNKAECVSNKLEEMARKNGFTSATAALNYAVECKNASNGLETPANGILPDDVSVFLEYLVELNLDKYDISPCASKLVDRYRVGAKNAPQGQQTLNKGISDAVKTATCDRCERFLQIMREI